MLRNKVINVLAFIKARFSLYVDSLRKHTQNFTDASFEVILICIAGFLFLYYLIGAMLTNNIDRNTNYTIPDKATNQSQTIEMIAYLINREVNDKIWTPNLPFFFPASILDNMPNFQLGILNGISKFTNSLEKRIDIKIQNKENTSQLYKATVLLRYPGTVWMFSPHNKIKPVPSASNQYRKARRLLIKYNQSLILGQNTFYKNPADLAYILHKAKQNLAQSSNQLNSTIREESSSFFNNKADDIFYYNQGKIYAYYLLLQALGHDYKNIILNANQYQSWISLNKALEDAVRITPMFIRNGELNSSFTPNHLSYLNAYILKAQNLLDKICSALNNHNIKE